MNLKEKLLEEYDDINGQMDAYDYGTDGYKRLERKGQHILDQLVCLEESEIKLKIEEMKIQAAAEEKEKDRKHETKLNDETFSRKYESDYRSESARYNHEMEVERLRRKKSGAEIALEIGKIVVPVAVPIIAYNVFQKRMLKFEEVGHISSTAGRELHLPRFFK